MSDTTTPQSKHEQSHLVTYPRFLLRLVKLALDALRIRAALSYESLAAAAPFGSSPSWMVLAICTVSFSWIWSRRA